MGPHFQQGLVGNCQGNLQLNQVSGTGFCLGSVYLIFSECSKTKTLIVFIKMSRYRWDEHWNTDVHVMSSNFSIWKPETFIFRFIFIHHISVTFSSRAVIQKAEQPMRASLSASDNTTTTDSWWFQVVDFWVSPTFTETLQSSFLLRHPKQTRKK